MHLLNIKKNVLLVGLSLLLSLTAVFSFYHILPVFLMQVGFSKRSLGTVYTVFLFTYNFGQLLGGILLKKIEPRKLYAISTFVVALLMMSLYFTMPGGFVFIILFFMYLFWGIQLPPQSVIVHASEQDSAKGFSQIEFFALSGILIGPFAGFLLLKHMNISVVLLFAGVLEIVVTILRKSVRIKNDKFFEKTSSISLDKRIIIITLFVSLAFFVFYATSDGPFIPAVLKRELSMNMRDISLLFGIATLISILFIPVFYYLSRYIGMWRVMGISVFIHGMFVYIWSLNYGTLFILIMGFVAVQPVYTYFIPLVMDGVGKNKQGATMGLVGFLSGAIGSLSPILLKNAANPFLYAFLVSVLASVFPLLFPLKNKGFPQGVDKVLDKSS